MDPSLGRFTSPDTIVPTGTQGTQAWDRYAFVNNNPVRYNDPTGYRVEDDEDEDESNNDDGPFTSFDSENCPGTDCTIENSFQVNYDTLSQMETDLLNLQSDLYTNAELLGGLGVIALLATFFPNPFSPVLAVGGTLSLLAAGAAAYEASQLTYLIQMVGEMKDAAKDAPAQTIAVMAFRSPSVRDSNISLTYQGANRAYTPNSIATSVFLSETLDVYTPFAPFILQ
jgi:hypothetical protein